MKKLISSPIRKFDSSDTEKEISGELSDEMKRHYEKAGALVSIGLYQDHYARLQRAVRAFDAWKNSDNCKANYHHVATLRGDWISAISQFSQKNVGGYFAATSNEEYLKYLGCECCTCLNKDCAPITQFNAIKVILVQVKHWLKKVRAYILYNGGTIPTLPTEYLNIAQPQSSNTAKRVPNATSPIKMIPRANGLKPIQSKPNQKD